MQFSKAFFSRVLVRFRKSCRVQKHAIIMRNISSEQHWNWIKFQWTHRKKVSVCSAWGWGVFGYIVFLLPYNWYFCLYDFFQSPCQAHYILQLYSCIFLFNIFFCTPSLTRSLNPCDIATFLGPFFCNIVSIGQMRGVLCF